MGVRIEIKNFTCIPTNYSENTGYVFLGVYPYVPLQIHGSRAIWVRLPQGGVSPFGVAIFNICPI